ncbi:MAG: hypothetical protein AAGC96_10530 [Pseudomonadota bacterium]
MMTSRCSWTAAALLCLLVMSGCVSASLEDAAPTSDTTTGAIESQATDATQTEAAVTDAAETSAEIRDNSFVEEGAIRDDTFPTFERSPTAANEQISDEEKEKLLAEMEALKASMKRRGAGAGNSDARYQELQNLAREHADETKQQIEQ